MRFFKAFGRYLKGGSFRLKLGFISVLLALLQIFWSGYELYQAQDVSSRLTRLSEAVRRNADATAEWNRSVQEIIRIAARDVHRGEEKRDQTLAMKTQHYLAQFAKTNDGKEFVTALYKQLSAMRNIYSSFTNTGTAQMHLVGFEENVSVTINVPPDPSGLAQQVHLYWTDIADPQKPDQRFIDVTAVLGPRP